MKFTTFTLAILFGLATQTANAQNAQSLIDRVKSWSPVPLYQIRIPKDLTHERCREDRLDYAKRALDMDGKFEKQGVPFRCKVKLSGLVTDLPVGGKIVGTVPTLQFGEFAVKSKLLEDNTIAIEIFYHGSAKGEVRQSSLEEILKKETLQIDLIYHGPKE